MIGRRARLTDGDDGAVLILALIFVAVVGLVGGVIALFASSSLAQASGQKVDRAQQFAAESAVQVAIQTVRDLPAAGGDVRNAPGYNGTACQPMAIDIPENGVTQQFTVNCVVGQSPANFERSITFAACPQGVTCLTGRASFTPTASSRAIVVTTVTYYDLNNNFTFATGNTNGSGGWSVGNAVDVGRWDVTKANS